MVYWRWEQYLQVCQGLRATNRPPRVLLAQGRRSGLVMGYTYCHQRTPSFCLTSKSPLRTTDRTHGPYSEGIKEVAGHWQVSRVYGVFHEHFRKDSTLPFTLATFNLFCDLTNTRANYLRKLHLRIRLKML